MSTVSIESLKQQLVASEAELELAKSHVYRLDGVIQLLKHLITDAEKPEIPAETAETPASV